MAAIYNRPVHIAHVSLKEEVLLIKAAKERGLKVTCGGLPASSLSHPGRRLTATYPRTSASLSAEHGEALRGGRGEVRPRLAAKEDVEALWANLEVIDCFATTTPRTPSPKRTAPTRRLVSGPGNAPAAATDGGQRWTVDHRRHHPKIGHQPAQNLPPARTARNLVEVDETARFEIRAGEMHSRCRWTPFEGWPVRAGCAAWCCVDARHSTTDRCWWNQAMVEM